MLFSIRCLLSHFHYFSSITRYSYIFLQSFLYPPFPPSLIRLLGFFPLRYVLQMVLLSILEFSTSTSVFTFEIVVLVLNCCGVYSSFSGCTYQLAWFSNLLRDCSGTAQFSLIPALPFLHWSPFYIPDYLAICLKRLWRDLETAGTSLPQVSALFLVSMGRLGAGQREQQPLDSLRPRDEGRSLGGSRQIGREVTPPTPCLRTRPMTSLSARAWLQGTREVSAHAPIQLIAAVAAVEGRGPGPFAGGSSCTLTPILAAALVVLGSHCAPWSRWPGRQLAGRYSSSTPIPLSVAPPCCAGWRGQGPSGEG